MKRIRKEIAARALVVERLESRTLLSADLGPQNDRIPLADNGWHQAIFASSVPRSSHGQSAGTPERAGGRSISNDGQFRPGEHASGRMREATGRGDPRGASPIALQTPGQNSIQNSGQTTSTRNANESTGRTSALLQTEPSSGRIGVPPTPNSFSAIVATPSLSSVVDTPLESLIGRASNAASLRAAAADIALESNQVTFEDGLSENDSPSLDRLLRSESNAEGLQSPVEDGFIYPDVSPLQRARELALDPELQPTWKIDLAIFDWLQKSLPTTSDGESSAAQQSYWSESESLVSAMDWSPAQGGFVDLLDSEHSLFLPVETPRWVDVALIPTIGMNQPIAMQGNQPTDALPPLPMVVLKVSSPISENPAETSEQPPAKLARFSVPAALTSTGILLATLQWRRLRKRTESDPPTKPLV